MADNLSALRARLEARAGGDPAHVLTVADLVGRFMAHARDYYPSCGRASSSEYTNFRDAVRPLLLLYADDLARQLAPLHVRAVRELMIEQGLARSTINGRIKRIRHVLRWGVSMGYLEPDVPARIGAMQPLKRGRCKAREPDPVRAVTWDEVEPVLFRVSSRIAALIRLQWLTGMRPGEVCAMRGAELDTDADPWTYRPVRHKTSYLGTTRTIYLGPGAQAVAGPWLLAAGPGYLFTRRRGVPIRTSSYYTAVRRACIEAGVQHWSPNQLRHAAATRFRSELGIEAARLLLGHADAGTTLIYAERDERAAAAAALRVG